MADTKDILKLLDEIAPFDLSEGWDNSGLQVGNMGTEVKKVLIGLDVSEPLMNSAKNGKFDLVITHHPLMIHPEKSIDFSRMPGKAIEIAAKHDISIVSVHTNIDKASGGLNDFFASAVGLRETTPFLTDTVSGSANDTDGLGRIGSLEAEVTLKQLVLQVKEKLNLSHLRVTGNLDLPVTTVAVCTGSGGSLIDEFINSRAQVYISGDIKYHDARRVEEFSKGMIDVGHFGSERMAIDLLFEKIGQAFQKAGLHIKLKKYLEEKDPFTIF